MFQEYTNLSEEELDEKMENVMKKIHSAHTMGLDDVVSQLKFILENMQMELADRLDKMRFDIISDKTPTSLVIGEDDGRDEPADDD